MFPAFTEPITGKLGLLPHCPQWTVAVKAASEGEAGAVVFPWSHPDALRAQDRLAYCVDRGAILGGAELRCPQG